MFAVGALVAERYGLPTPLTHYSDKGFDHVEAFLTGTELPRSDFIAAAEDYHPDPDAPMTPTPAAALMPGSPTTVADNSGLDVNADALEIIKASRGLTLSATEEAGLMTIGYGHIVSDKETTTITVPKAEELLLADLQPAEQGILEMVTVPLNENEYSALVSFVDSIGPENLAGTDVYRKLQSGDRAGAAEALSQQTMARIDGELRQMPHLMERRERERELFQRQP